MRESFGRAVTVSMVLVLLFAVSIARTPDIADSVAAPYAAPVHLPAAIVWSEDFEDGDISDWMVFEINWTLPDGVVNFTVDSAELYDLSGGVLRSIGPEWNFAMHNSSVAYGTWSFDIDIQRPDDFDRFAVGFIGENFSEHWLPSDGSSDGYLISILIPDEDPEGYVRLATNTYPGTTTFIDSYRVEDIRGWKNFIVTREFDREGQFYVYMDGDLILKAVDKTHTTSEYFTVFGMANHAIDNITVSDTIDYDAAPPEWSVTLYKEIEEGEPLYYDVNATDYSGVDQFWMLENENFAMTEDGIVTNITDLAEGIYNMIVKVNDTGGFTQTGSFTVRVTPTPTVTPTTTTTSTTPTTSPGTTTPPPAAIPLEILATVIAVPLVLIIILVVWRSRK